MCFPRWHQILIFKSDSSPEKPVLVPGGYFPDDLDTTSMALTVLKPDAELTNSLLEEMLTYLNPDGTFQVNLIFSNGVVISRVKVVQNTLFTKDQQTYFDRKKPRTDTVVSANVLTCLYSFGRGREHGLELSLQLIRQMLSSRESLQPTRYYPSIDCCLFFIGRLLRSSGDEYLQDTLGSVLKDRVSERVGESGSAMDIAMRMIVCKWLNVGIGGDSQTLLSMQCDDGGWNAGWLLRYGSTGVKVGNRGVATAMAIRALKP